MKNLLWVITILACNLSYAQESEQQVLHRKPEQEIGLMQQFGPGETNPDNMYLAGILYKRFTTEHLGYRLFAAYGAYDYKEDYSLVSMRPDTFMQQTNAIHTDMAMIGGGLEAQRKFYRNIWFFAALEIKSGYGTGYVDTLVDKTYPLTNGYDTYGTNSRGQNGDLKMFYASFTPTIGVKVQHSRLAAGLELLPVHISLRHTNYYNQYSLSSADLALLNLSTRIFASYRF